MTAFEPSAGPPEDAGSAGARLPVAAAMARLDGVHQLPLHEQPDVYQAAHTELQNALVAIDDA